MYDPFLAKAKCLDTREWVEGFYMKVKHQEDNSHVHYFILKKDLCLDNGLFHDSMIEVDPLTFSPCSGISELHGDTVFVNDIVFYETLSFETFVGQVCFGLYEQDGSHGEYSSRSCLGFYIKRIYWIPQYWEDMDDRDLNWREFEETVSLASVSQLMKLGNIFDNPDLLEINFN